MPGRPDPPGFTKPKCLCTILGGRASVRASSLLLYQGVNTLPMAGNARRITSGQKWFRRNFLVINSRLRLPILLGGKL